MFGLRNTTSATPSHRGADAALVAHSSGRRGRASLLQGEPCLPESVWLTIRPERSLAASGKSVRWLSVTPLVTLDHRPAAIRWAARGDHAEGWRGGGWSLPAKPCVPEPPVTMFWSAQYRSASDRRVNWLYITTCETGAQHAYVAGGGGAGEALFRRLLDPRRACPQHDWASGYSVRSSRPTLGRWLWLYRPG